MRYVPATALKRWITQFFVEVDCHHSEAKTIARCLVESNLAGHDSHGVIRVPDYIGYVQRDQVRPNRHIETVLRSGSFALLDGQFGFGQSIGRQAMELGIEMAREFGVAAIALRNSGHLGRIADWPLQLADAGLASFHFVNTNGFGLLVAPYGGMERRLSANPIAAGFPRPQGSPIILDISTCAIAEGKLKVARNQGQAVPPDCIIDAQGKPTTDPQRFYADPPGALLPFGAHKGYGLSVFAELFAGALTGHGCTNPDRQDRLLNGMFSLIVDPMQTETVFNVQAEVDRFLAYLKSSRTLDPAAEILVPGELEERTRARRRAEGIPVDEVTWQSLVDTAQQLGLADAPPDTRSS